MKDLQKVNARFVEMCYEELPKSDFCVTHTALENSHANYWESSTTIVCLNEPKEEVETLGILFEITELILSWIWQLSPAYKANFKTSFAVSDISLCDSTSLRINIAHQQRE